MALPPEIHKELLHNWAALSATEKVLLLSLCGLVVLMYVYAGWILLSGAVRWTARRVRGPARAKPGQAEAAPAAEVSLGRSVRATSWRTEGRRRRHWVWRVLRGTTLTLSAAGGLCVAYAFFVEPYWPEITRFELRSDRLPAGREFVRIVHISDMHCDGDVVRLEYELPALIRQVNPDLIVWTGDAANDAPAGMERFYRTMGRIAEIAPTYGVIGNWDYNARRKLPGVGVTVLEGRFVDVDIRGAGLRLVNGQAHQSRRVAQWIQQADPERYVVLLNHFPDFILSVKNAVNTGRMPDLFLAGHTHGGQIRLPFHGAIVTQQETGRLFENGMVEFNGTQVHVSRGIGMNGNLPRARFLCRPEIAVIDLYSSKGDGENGP